MYDQMIRSAHGGAIHEQIDGAKKGRPRVFLFYAILECIQRQSCGIQNNGCERLENFRKVGWRVRNICLPRRTTASSTANDRCCAQLQHAASSKKGRRDDTGPTAKTSTSESRGWQQPGAFPTQAGIPLVMRPKSAKYAANLWVCFP